MSEPKRHHWWPEVQSRRWTLEDNKVHVTRKDGTSFRANPRNIGVESELYTRFAADHSKNAEVETWFAEQIDGPIRFVLDYLADVANRRHGFFRGERRQADVVRELGFVIDTRVETLILTPEVRGNLAKYISALLVRHPRYLAEIIDFHRRQFPEHAEWQVRNLGLDNMLWMYERYVEVIRDASFMVIERSVDTEDEFLYVDGGLSVEEPWKQAYGIPFDIHAPLTPELSIEVLPSPLKRNPNNAHIGRVNRRGVNRFNRIVLAKAERFVFSRNPPPLKFVQKHFGNPAPKNIGYRVKDGVLETRYDPNRQ